MAKPLLQIPRPAPDLLQPVIHTHWRLVMIIRALAVLGIGAAAMYFLDPESGRRRRALLRDKVAHYRKEGRAYARGTSKDLRNRAHGLVAEARGMVERRVEQRRQASELHIDPAP
jgi:hypothetical protein